jgi:hypothetical protein
LFPQDDLQVGLSGGSRPPVAITVGQVANLPGAGQVVNLLPHGTSAFYGVSALRPGEDKISVKWRDTLAQQVPVAVGDAWTDLRIEPAVAAVPPGSALDYQVSAVHNGARHAVGPEHGLRLAVDDPRVATVVGSRIGRAGTLVRGESPGRTAVTAQLAGQKAEATLDVTSRTKRAGIAGVAGRPGGIGGIGDIGDWWDYDPDWFVIPDWVIGGLDGTLIGDDTGVVVVPGVVPQGGVVVGPGGRSVVRVPGETRRDGVPGKTRPSGAEGTTPAAVGLSITPDHVRLEPGQSTPVFVARELDSAGHSHTVPAILESMDLTVLRPDPDTPGRFVAKGYGTTKVRAAYQGREASAVVEVAGQRFTNVTVSTSSQVGTATFDMTVLVRTAQSEGRMEYRIYEAGQTPPDHWTAAEPRDGGQQVELRIPQLEREKKYRLVIEGRDGPSGTVEQYLLPFMLSINQEK